MITKIKIKTNGFTLIELMIAMALGLVLIAGAIFILISTRQNSQMQQAVTLLQDNGRVATKIFARHIRMAGFCNEALELQIPCSEIFTETNPPVSGIEGGGINPDQLTLRYASDGSMRDCLGNTIAKGGTSDNTFLVQTLDQNKKMTAYAIHPEFQYQLVCRDASGGEMILMDGVENMQVLYGIDTDADQIANRYVTATTVQANDNWNNVVAITLELMLRSQNNAVELQAKTNRLLGVQWVSHDRRLRYLFATTVSLRNRVR